MAFAGAEVWTACAVFGMAGVVHAGFGFGTALVAQPLLVLAFGFATATPLVGLAALSSIAIVLAREWRGLDYRAAGRLLLASLPGIPCGLVLVSAAPPGLLRGVLGIVLVSYGAFNLLRPSLPRLRSESLIYFFGFLAGVLGGACNVNGPPVVVYGALARWDPARFRATVQGFFLPSALLICAAHAGAGLWTRTVFELYAGSLPGLLLGHVLGLMLARRVALAHFTRALYALLTVFGVLMLLP